MPSDPKLTAEQLAAAVAKRTQRAIESVVECLRDIAELADKYAAVAVEERNEARAELARIRAAMQQISRLYGCDCLCRDVPHSPCWDRKHLLSCRVSTRCPGCQIAAVLGEKGGE